MATQGDTPNNLHREGADTRPQAMSGPTQEYFDRQLEEKLREACCMGDLRAAGELLSSGVNVDGQHAMNKWTSLHWAAQRGHVNIVELLLSYGARTDVVNADNKTAVEVASSAGIQTLLQNGMSTSSSNGIRNGMAGKRKHASVNETGGMPAPVSAISHIPPSANSASHFQAPDGRDIYTGAGSSNAIETSNTVTDTTMPASSDSIAEVLAHGSLDSIIGCLALAFPTLSAPTLIAGACRLRVQSSASQLHVSAPMTRVFCSVHGDTETQNVAIPVSFSTHNGRSVMYVAAFLKSVEHIMGIPSEVVAGVTHCKTNARYGRNTSIVEAADGEEFQLILQAILPQNHN